MCMIVGIVIVGQEFIIACELANMNDWLDLAPIGIDIHSYSHSIVAFGFGLRS